MLSTTEWFGALPKLDNTLLVIQEQLVEVLAACIPSHQTGWVGVLQHTLMRAEEMLRQRLARAETPEQPRAAVGPVQATLDRQQLDLNERYLHLLEQSLALQAEIDRAPLSAWFGDVNPGNQLPQDRAGEGVDWEGLCQRTEQFLTDLQQTTEMELRLVHETVNMDIGVGD